MTWSIKKIIITKPFYSTSTKLMFVLCSYAQKYKIITGHGWHTTLIPAPWQRQMVLCEFKVSLVYLHHELQDKLSDQKKIIN